MREAALIAGVDKSTFWRWINAQKVSATRVGGRIRVLESVARAQRKPIGAACTQLTISTGE
jgi:predicted DNA-binding protein (UPF0251 family)